MEADDPSDILLGRLATGDTAPGAASQGPASPVPPRPVGSHREADSRRRLLWSLLGELPDRARPISSRKLCEGERDGYILEDLELDLNDLEPVSALLARPRGRAGKAPAVLFNHSHGGRYDIGRRELVEGRSYLQPKPYAKELTDLGYIVLSIDHWVFGGRAHTSESDMFKAMLWEGRVLWGMMVHDSVRALDYLVSRPDVDASRLATLGMSMGSTMAWWLAALDERVRVTVDLCCLTDFQTLIAKRGLSGHGIYYYVPSLLRHFTTAGINALIAPRAHLAIAGLRDALTPVEGLDLIDRELREVYAAAGCPESWKLLRYDVPHQETAEARREIVEFLGEHL